MIEFVEGRSSLRARSLHAMCRVFVYSTLTWFPMNGPLSRCMFLVDAVFKPLPRLKDVRHEGVRGNGWRAELFSPASGASERGAILYMHGGAFLFCGINSHRRITERLALRTGMHVLSVDYRQLPKALLDQSVADCVEAFQWLVERGFAPDEVVLAGDSAGGHLTFAVSLRLAQLGRPGAAGLVAMSPWLDFDDVAKLAHDNLGRDVFIPARRLRELADSLFGGEEINESLSPVNADLSVLPPVLMMCAADEVLRVDSELMAERLEKAGVTHRLQIWSGMVHAFPVLAHATPETSRALDVIAGFAVDCVAASTDRLRPSIAS